VHAIGVDVGGTKIAAGLVDTADGTIVERRLVPTGPERGGDAVLDDVRALVAELQPSRSVPVGVGVCELVSTDQTVESEFIVRWRGVPVRERLGGVVLQSDIRAAALAEARLGAGRGAGSFAYLTIGTGIGLVFVQDGVPWPGARGSAGTLGYSPLVAPGGETFVVEPFASGAGLAARFRERGGGAEGAEDVLAAALRGDTAAAAVVREGAAVLGACVGNAVDLLDPELIVLGGGLGLAPGLYRDVLVESIRASIWSDTNRSLPIVEAQLGVDAGVVGAALGAFRVAVEDRPPGLE
jgi:glucokinase